MKTRNLILKPGDLRSLPTAPSQLFEREAPLALEIGFGGGRFLEHLSGAHPDWNVLGVELSGGSMSRAFKRLRRADRRHVRLFRGDGRFVVRDVLPSQSLHRVYVNFPSPWPKRKHRDRRLLRISFLRLLAARLAPSGALHLTTDHSAYFHASVRAARATGLYRFRFTAPPPGTLGTKYAQRWQRQDKQIRHALLRRRRPPAHAPAPLIQTTPMHHAILQGALPDLDDFEKQVYHFAGGTVVILKAYRAVGDDGYLFLTLIQEDAFQQRVLIEARPSEDDIFVGVKTFGDVLSTQGTSEAINCVTDWLCERGLHMKEALY